MINGLYIAVLVLRWKVGSRTAVLHEVGCSCPSLFDYPTVQRPHDGRARKQQQPTAEKSPFAQRCVPGTDLQDYYLFYLKQ
jgi:hypothetical protein